MATRTTSSGSCTMISPLSENITRMVNSSAIRVMGLMRGMNSWSYHSLLLKRSSVNRVMMPATKGMPR